MTRVKYMSTKGGKGERKLVNQYIKMYCHTMERNKCNMKHLHYHIAFLIGAYLGEQMFKQFYNTVKRFKKNNGAYFFLIFIIL